MSWRIWSINHTYVVMTVLFVPVKTCVKINYIADNLKAHWHRSEVMQPAAPVKKHSCYVMYNKQEAVSYPFVHFVQFQKRLVRLLYKKITVIVMRRALSALHVTYCGLFDRLNARELLIIFLLNYKDHAHEETRNLIYFTIQAKPYKAHFPFT